MNLQRCFVLLDFCGDAVSELVEPLPFSVLLKSVRLDKTQTSEYKFLTHSSSPNVTSPSLMLLVLYCSVF